MKKFLKIALIIVSVLIILLTIYYIRNYIVLRGLFEKIAQYDNVTNFYYEVRNNYSNGAEDVYSKNYRKDMISVLEVKNGERTIIDWRNAETKEVVDLFVAQKTATTRTTTEQYYSYMPTFERSPYVSLISFVYNEEVNGQKCVVIKIGESKWWINKETGLMVKVQSGTVNINGEEKPAIVEYSNWKINQLTDEDVARPNLEGYEVIEN